MSNRVVCKVTGRLEKGNITVLLMSRLTCLHGHGDKMQTNFSLGEECVGT